MLQTLKYQLDAVDGLLRNTYALLQLNGNRHRLIFKAPTGSGKTVMAAHYLQRLAEELPQRLDLPFQEAAYIWIAPNELHIQSYEKLKGIFAETRALNPIKFEDLDSAEAYIRPGEILFLNWQSINSDNNIFVRDNETGNTLYRYTDNTQRAHGVPIIVIIDEEHLFGGRTAVQSEKVLQKINPKIELRISATPKSTGTVVEVPRQKVIDEQMIKKTVILNPALSKNAMEDLNLNQTLIRKSLDKRQEIAEAYKKNGEDINPLLLIQLPNDNKTVNQDDKSVLEEVKIYLDAMYSINVENGRLAIWLADDKTPNLEDISKEDSIVDVLIFKQAIALGWDCPRAAVLLIFREIKSTEFSVQTVGRIMRMPHQHFYPDETLNNGYVYTNLSKDIIRVVAEDMSYISSDYIRSDRREGLHNIKLKSYYTVYKSSDRNRLGPDFKAVLKEMFRNEAGLDSHQLTFDFFDEPTEQEMKDLFGIYAENRIALRDNLHIDTEVHPIRVEIPENVEITDDEQVIRLDGHRYRYPRTMDEIGRAFSQFCSERVKHFERVQATPALASALKQVMEELFGYDENQTPRIILFHENTRRFIPIIDKALQKYEQVLGKKKQRRHDRSFKEVEWEVPAERLYNEETNSICPGMDDHALQPFVMLKNHYHPEEAFASYLEDNHDCIDWWYKNGDDGMTHYSVPYINKHGERSLFYVDYVIRMKNGQVFLFDTKTENSDEDAPNKHNALLKYLPSQLVDGYTPKGGIIIEDGDSDIWKYSPLPISNTTDTRGWDVFNPSDYKEKK